MVSEIASKYKYKAINLSCSVSNFFLKLQSIFIFIRFPYQNLNYFDAMDHLVGLKAEGKIKNIGLTNFDTTRVKIMIEKGFKLVSNQVQYSILDQRPEKLMAPFCQKHGMHLLTYGTLLGGFLSEKYLDSPDPHRAELITSSLQKYHNMNIPTDTTDIHS